jgi:hypothetical protein
MAGFRERRPSPPRESRTATHFEVSMAERTRNRRNTLERRCLPKTFKRMFAGAPKGIFKMLEKVKRAK